MITSSILKQMRNDTLVSLNLYKLTQNTDYELNTSDYKALSDYIKQTHSLREIDFKHAEDGFKHLSEAVKQNKSIVKLGVSRIIDNENVGLLTDILETNSTISDLNIDSGDIEGEGFAEFVKAMRAQRSITHISADEVNYNERTENYNLRPLFNALTKSPNILHFLPKEGRGQADLEKVCSANKDAVKHLIVKASQHDARDLTVQDVSDILTRLPAFLNIAETESIRHKGFITRMLVNIEDVAGSLGLDFPMPVSYADMAGTIPRLFDPSADKVDFAQTAPAKALDSLEIYKAVEAGQVSELLSFLQRQGRKITAADCLFKPEGKRESMIELVARQGTLPSIMTVANWTGNPRGFKEAAAAVPVREWTRQMDMPLDNFLSYINIISFKKAHQLRL